MVDARDLKSLDLGRAGSIPAPGTKHLQHFLVLIPSPWRTRRICMPSPGAPQGSTLGSWLAITQVRFPPTKVRAIAEPH